MINLSRYISFSEKLYDQAIKKPDIYKLRFSLKRGQKIKITVPNIYGQFVDKSQRTYKGRIAGVHKHFITVDVGNWKTCFTYIELLQPKTEVLYYD